MHKQCESVLGGNSRDAEIPGCSMWIERVNCGSTSACVDAILSFPFAWCIFLVECLPRELIVIELHTLDSFSSSSCVRCSQAECVWERRSDVQFVV